MKYLPVYALPAGRPSNTFSREGGTPGEERDAQLERMQTRPSTRFASPPPSPTQTRKMAQAQAEVPTLNMTSPTPPVSRFRAMSVDIEKGALSPNLRGTKSFRSFLSGGPAKLMPSYNPPRYAIFDVFPFSLFVKFLSKRGKHVKGKKGAKVRAREGTVTHNIPLELTLYLVRGCRRDVRRCCY